MSAVLKQDDFIRSEAEIKQEKRKRGRPPLPGKRTKIRFPSERWVPKRWRPEYEIIVALWASGMSRKAIIDRFYELSGTLYTEQHITNIVNTPEARKILDNNVDNIRENSTKQIQARISALHDKALTRMEKLMEDDEKYDASPFAVVDRAIKIMDVGKVKESAAPNGINVQSALIMTPEAAKILMEGTQKADEAKKLYAGQ